MYQVMERALNWDLDTNFLFRFIFPSNLSQTWTNLVSALWYVKWTSALDNWCERKKEQILKQICG